MTKIYSYTTSIEANVLDAFCCLQGMFGDQFVYYDKASDARRLGLGRCVALPSLRNLDVQTQGEFAEDPVFFSFNRFDADNPTPADDLMSSFPRLLYMLPEVVLLVREGQTFLQVNSLGPVSERRAERFCREACKGSAPVPAQVPYELEEDSYEEWEAMVEGALSQIREGKLHKVVLSRRRKVRFDDPGLSSVDALLNLVASPANGTVFLYRYDDVFFCGCTPELLVRKVGDEVQTMCLAGTCPSSPDPDKRAALGQALLRDQKNLAEHAFVVDFISHVVSRLCYDVEIPASPQLKELPQLQHLCTPVQGKIMSGRTLSELANQLHPTPALSGSPVGQAMMALRQLEPYNRGFFGGTAGFVNASGGGEFVVTIRSGVFDGEEGYIYAGCGIVEGSVPADEYQETNLKMRTVVDAFGGGSSDGVVPRDGAALQNDTELCHGAEPCCGAEPAVKEGE